MAKLSKTTRTVIIAAGVLLVLGIVCLVLFMTEPKEEENSSSDLNSSAASDTLSSETDPALVLTDKSSSNVTSLKVTNSTGEFTFTQQKRVVSTTDEDGNVTSSDEIYWDSEQLNGITPSDSTIKAFMNCMASLTASELVEENADDLAKYGLDDTAAVAEVTFDDGSVTKLYFGIKNPAKTNFVYCRKDDSNDVFMASYYSVDDVYCAISDFVKLTLTSSYDANNPKELDYLIIERKDLAEPVEISYMYDVYEDSLDEDAIITTFNSHRVTSPMVAEIDSTKGQTLCYGLYGLTASSCVSVKADEELLQQTGLNDPFCKVTFKFAGSRNVLLLGNKIITETATDDPETPTLTTVLGYYGKLEGSDAIYAFSVEGTPWYDFTLQGVISRRPLSPYIYNVDSLEITTPDGEYLFNIDGDASENKFNYGEQVLDGDNFRKFYQHLIAAVGDELYFEDGDYAPYIKVKFNYRPEFYDVYGTEADVLEFYQSDDRKNIVRVNGEVLFKVRQVYTERLLENLDALLSGGKINLDW